MKETQNLLHHLEEVEYLREKFRKWWEDNKLNSVLLINRENLQEKFDNTLACASLPESVKKELLAERDRLLRIAGLLDEARDIWNGIPK